MHLLEHTRLNTPLLGLWLQTFEQMPQSALYRRSRTCAAGCKDLELSRRCPKCRAKARASCRGCSHSNAQDRSTLGVSSTAPLACSAVPGRTHRRLTGWGAAFASGPALTPAPRAPPAQKTPRRPPVRGRGQGRVAPDHGRLHTRAVRGERGFYLGGAHAVAGHVDDVVHAARDGVVPARVALAAVAGEVQALRRARRFSGRPATPCSLCARPTGAAVVAAPGSGATRRGLAAYRAPMHHVPPNVPNTCNTPPDTAS